MSRPYKPRKIIVERSIAGTATARMIVDRFPTAPVEEVERVSAFKSGPAEQALLIAEQRSRFIKKCPGTPKYACCDYFVLDLGIGCLYNCSYCYLHHYMNSPFLVYANVDDLIDEVGRFCAGRPNKVVRLGSGEFIDSVGIGSIIDYNRMLVPALARIPNLVFEIKTKSAAVESILNLDHRGRVVISWSLNPEKVAVVDEAGADKPADRLAAAARCAAAGYRIGFHFDPMIYYDGWLEDYGDLVERLFAAVRPARIAWISLGALRFNPALKPILKEKFPNSSLVYAELLPGLDGKYRYFLGQRRQMFQEMTKVIRRRAPRVPVYLCMESPELAAAVGATPVADIARSAFPGGR